MFVLCEKNGYEQPWMCSGCLVLPVNFRVRVRMIWLGSELVFRVSVKLGLGFGVQRLYGQTMDCAWFMDCPSPWLEHNILYI